MNEPSDMEFSTALTNIGDMQIELIQQLNDAPSLYQDFYKTTGEGMHHMAYWFETKQLDEKCKWLESKGYKVGQSGELGAKGRFIYYINDDLLGTIIELSEKSGLKGKMFKAIANTAANWDGSNPIRG